MAKGLFERATDGLVSMMGYFPITKAQTEQLAKTQAVAMNPNGVGYLNTIEQIKKYGMKKPGRVNFKLLREIAKRDAVIRICVNVIKKAVSQCPWEIRLKKEAPGDKELYESIRMEVYDLFEYMNENGETLRVVLDKILEDLLVLDAAAIEKVLTLDGSTIVALNPVDGATIRPVYNVNGVLGSPAYKQFVGEKETASFEKEELVYLMANPQNDVDLFGYGLSPIESILLQVQASLEADMHNIKTFSTDNIPPGILDLGDIDEQEAKKFIAIWNATVIGNTQQMKFVWGNAEGKKYHEFKKSNKDMQYAEYIDWLTRIKLAVYGLSSLDANMLQDVNRATAEVQQAISQSRGVKSTKSLVEEYFTRQIIRHMGDVTDKKSPYRYLEFKFIDAESLADKKTQAEIDAMHVKNGLRSADELRERDGLEPLEVEMEMADELDIKMKELDLQARQNAIDAGADGPMKGDE